MANMYAETSDFKDPSLGKEIVKQTRQQIVDKYSELNKVFPDLHYQVIQTYPSGDQPIIVELASSGTAPNQAPVPRFSSEDPNNTTTMVVRAIYNIVG